MKTAVTTIVVAICVLTFHGGGIAAPSPLAPDALLESQWHLKDRSLEVGGANVRDAWPISTGAGVVIGIVDDGLQWAHPDLAPNYLASLSFDFNFNDSDPQPFTTAAHGTAVAGLAAARGDNTIGVAGAAPQASLAGLRLTAVAATDSQEASAFGFQPNSIHILNKSWKPTDNGITLKAPGPLATAARQSAITTGRQGKGRIFVWSSGNGRLVSDDCNYDGYANSRYAIAVGASTDAAVQVPTSEGCSALMVLSPAGGGIRSLTTTDLIGVPGYEPTDYTSLFGGTLTGGMNAAAPTVSGTVALMLARNSNLAWRDVQHILRQSSVRIMPTDPGWTTGTFPHHERSGFGLIDAEAAVNLAGSWTNVPAEEALAPVTRTVNLPIPDINSVGISSTITIASSESNFVIEHIEVDFNATHTWRGDLQVKLTSPTGVVSTLAPMRPSDNGDNFTNWKFGSVRHWGATAAGTWTLNVADKRFQDVGTWNNWTLRIYGYRVGSTPPGAFGKSSPANGAAGVSSSPALSWTASSGATSYEYCFDTTNDGVCTSWAGNGTNTTAVLNGLASGTTYYWHVRASNAAGIVYSNGASTAFWSFTTGTGATPPGAFGKTSPANGATGQSLTPALSWGASAGATSYDYCYDTTNDNACSAWTGAGASTSAALSGLAPGTTYYWQVRAINSAGTTYANGASTAFWSFTTIAVPGAFGKSSPPNGAPGVPRNLTLSWTASAGAANYDYCYDTTNDNACSAWVGVGASTSAALTGLAGGVTYYWQVRAVNGGGTTYANGAATAFWKFTTRATTSPIVDLNGDGSADVLAYDAGTGAFARQVSRADGGFDTTPGNWLPGWTVTPVTFNDDALTDFFLFNTASGAWIRMINTGDGFTPQSSGAWWQGWERIVSDFDGDGKSDLFLYDRVTGNWFKCLSTPTGFGCTQGAWNPEWDIYPVALNTDALGDLFLFNRSTGRWFWVLGEVDGTFTYPQVGHWAPDWNLHSTDLNGDGLTDWFMYRSATGEYYAALNNGNGYSYTAGNGWAAGWTPTMVDLDADGFGDLFLYNKTSGDWLELQGNGAGEFTSVGRGTWTSGWNIFPTDFNGDGRSDLLLYQPRTGDWLQAVNQTTGAFTYVRGLWQLGLRLVATRSVW